MLDSVNVLKLQKFSISLDNVPNIVEGELALNNLETRTTTEKEFVGFTASGGILIDGIEYSVWIKVENENLANKQKFWR